jgi:hypothetical protein
MDQFGDGKPSADDARPYLPTEIEPPSPPPGDARPYLPTEIEPPDLPVHTGPVYLPTQTGPVYPPTHTGLREPAEARRAGPAPEFMKYGPGVPGTPPGGTPPGGTAQTAERMWRTGRQDQPPRRPRRWRGLAGTALTVVLLAASAVVLYTRLHHAPFQVTAVAITGQTRSGCGVNVTGEISTNGDAGSVTYQWLFGSDQQAPQPLSQSVAAGQDTVDVTVVVQGSGHGSASRTVTLQVLGPDPRADSASVALRC